MSERSYARSRSSYSAAPKVLPTSGGAIGSLRQSPGLITNVDCLPPARGQQSLGSRVMTSRHRDNPPVTQSEPCCFRKARVPYRQ